MRRALVILTVMGASITHSAYALNCFELALKDEAGAIVPVARPPVGLVVGGQFIVEGALPPHVQREPVAIAQCPPSLAEGLRTTFNASCPGDERRENAAKANNVPIELIIQRCTEMDRALSGKDAKIIGDRYKDLPAAKEKFVP